MTTMLPIIMDTSFNKLAVIDDYSSFIWTTRYYASGDFELVVPANDKNIALFHQDYYVMRDDDENVGMIEDIVIKRDDDGKEQIIVSGKFLGGSILSRRIIAVQTTVTGTVSACVNTLLTDNVVNPSIANRKISNFIIGSHNISQTMDAQYTGKNLYETISNICETYGIGFKVTLNSSNQFVFQLYQGADRTYDQSVNPWVIFSDTYDNLLSSEYEENYEGMVTAVLVAGEGEGLERKTRWVTAADTGLNRYELYADRRDIQNDGTISDDEYNKLLDEAGKEKLSTYTAAFSGTVYFDSIQYKEDVNVGDLVVIQNDRWNLHINTRLVEVIESVSEAGVYSIIPTFGI